MSKVLFSTVKNEAPFLLEWIAYHRVIGFDRFIILSNDSTDGTDELLSALAEAGKIEYHRHKPDGISAQANAAKLANDRKLLSHDDWVLWLDADEFLVVNIGSGKLDELVKAVGSRIGILIPWRIFGDSGNDRHPGRTVSSAFTRCARRGFRPNLELKTLFRNVDGIAGLSGLCTQRPWIARGAGFGLDDFITGAGTNLQPNRINNGWLAGEELERANWLTPEEHGYRLAQINHYSVRTPEHFLLKRVRGRGWKADASGSRNDRHTARFYRRMNRNGREDRRILQHEAGTASELERLRALPSVAIAEQRAIEIVADQVARLSQSELQELVQDHGAVPEKSGAPSEAQLIGDSESDAATF